MDTDAVVEEPRWLTPDQQRDWRAIILGTTYNTDFWKSTACADISGQFFLTYQTFHFHFLRFPYISESSRIFCGFL